MITHGSDDGKADSHTTNNWCTKEAVAHYDVRFITVEGKLYGATRVMKTVCTSWRAD